MKAFIRSVPSSTLALSRLTLAALLACALPVPGTAQTGGTPPAAPSTATPPAAGAFNLMQAYRAALEQDAVIRAARAAADARRERLPQAQAQLRPNVSASFSRNKNDLSSTTPGAGGVPVDSERNYMSGSRAFTIRQPLYRPIQQADVRQAQAQVDDANAILDKETQNVAVRVATAYLEGLLAQDQQNLVLQQKATYTTQLDAVRKRFAAGAGVRTDIDESQARLDMVLAQELEARQQVDYTRRQLQVMVNSPVSALALLDERKLRLARPDPDRLESWVERAERNSPEIRSLQAQAEAARQEIDKARAGHLPTLDAVAQWSRTVSDNVNSVNSRYENKSIGLQLNVPLYAGGYVTSQMRQALAELERVQQSLEATRRDLGLRVEKEFRSITEGVLRIRALEQAVRSAEVMVHSNQRSFEGGTRTTMDILNAQEQRMVALRDLAQARYVYLLSRVRLQALTGQADASIIEDINAQLRS